MDADIFILTDIKAPRRSDGLYTYQLRCFDSKGNERTIWDRKPIEAFAIENATEYQATLTAMRDALKRMQKPSALKIYTDCEYIKTGVEKWSISWIESDWKTSKGKPVANAELWQEVLSLLSIHTYTFCIGEHHEYYTVMKNALKLHVK